MPKVFALGDPHLGFGVGKTMDRFGPEWIDHPEKFRDRVRASVGADDILLIPGDLSWATKRPQVEPDLAFLADLPGMKIAIKGNHDYWWESDRPIGYPGLLSPPFVVDALKSPPAPNTGGAGVLAGASGGVSRRDGSGNERGASVVPPAPPVLGAGGPPDAFLTTDHSALTTSPIGFAGTRGWDAPREGSETFANDKKTFERERRRLQKSLDRISDCAVKIVLLHYPPQPFLDILSGAGVTICVYGHVHVNSLPDDEKLAVFGETLQGVTCYCVACDRVDFTPVEVFAF